MGVGSRSHDFDDELKISFLISSSVAQNKLFNFIFCRTFRNVHLCGVFCIDGIFSTLSENLERIVSILSRKYLEKKDKYIIFKEGQLERGGGLTFVPSGICQNYDYCKDKNNEKGQWSGHNHQGAGIMSI